MKILAVSDVELDVIYSPAIRQRFQGVDLALGCGDLPYYYLEYIISTLDVPLYFVRGNHASYSEETYGETRYAPWGGVDLHRRVCKDPFTGLLLAGIEGCIRYNRGPHQYTQGEMWSMVFGMIPALMINRLRYGKFLDVFISHAPPWQVHDADDLPHHGVKAFCWFLRTFRPQLHLHGHIHVYRQDTVRETVVDSSRVINVYGYREIILDV